MGPKPRNLCPWPGCNRKKVRGLAYCAFHWQLNVKHSEERLRSAARTPDHVADQLRAEVARMRQRITQLEQNERVMLDALRTRRADGEAVDWDAVAALTDAQLRSFLKITRRVRGQQANPAAYALRWVRENLGAH